MFNLTSFNNLTDEMFSFVEMKRKRVNPHRHSVPKNKLSFFYEINGNFTYLILAEQFAKGIVNQKFHLGVSKRNPNCDDYDAHRGFEVALSKACDSLFGIKNTEPPSILANRKNKVNKIYANQYKITWYIYSGVV